MFTIGVVALRYQAWIDVGGTFTDCYVVEPNQPDRRSRLKTLSSGLVPISVTSLNAARTEFIFARVD